MFSDVVELTCKNVNLTPDIQAIEQRYIRYTRIPLTIVIRLGLFLCKHFVSS